MTPKKSFYKGGIVYIPLWRRFSASLTASPQTDTSVPIIYISCFYLFHLISAADTSLRCFSITKTVCHRSYKFVGEEGSQKCVVLPRGNLPTQNHIEPLIYSDTHYLANNNVLVYVFCFYND